MIIRTDGLPMHTASAYTIDLYSTCPAHHCTGELLPGRGAPPAVPPQPQGGRGVRAPSGHVRKEKWRVVALELQPPAGATMVSSSGSGQLLLPHSKMPFNSKQVRVEPGTDAVAWLERLTASVEAWKLDTTAVWISCPMVAADCIAAAAKLGFTYHHAEGEEAMLSLWLSDRVVSKIPPFATHTVGVGGFVLNSAGEVLVVKELASGPRAQYKLPGGMADLGEDLGGCAVREVWEETGVKTEFESLIAFRHRHNEGGFGRSNICAWAAATSLHLMQLLRTHHTCSRRHPKLSRYSRTHWGAHHGDVLRVMLVLRCAEQILWCGSGRQARLRSRWTPQSFPTVCGCRCSSAFGCSAVANACLIHRCLLDRPEYES
jgi:ADP-ribose pyrophosphatase YjhB (NUDIX family)